MLGDGRPVPETEGWMIFTFRLEQADESLRTPPRGRRRRPLGSPFS
jgi:hypothetical protein